MYFNTDSAHFSLLFSNPTIKILDSGITLAMISKTAWKWIIISFLQCLSHTNHIDTSQGDLAVFLITLSPKFSHDFSCPLEANFQSRMGLLSSEECKIDPKNSFLSFPSISKSKPIRVNRVRELYWKPSLSLFSLSLSLYCFFTWFLNAWFDLRNISKILSHISC